MEQIAVSSPFDALVLIQEAFKNRAISQTYMVEGLCSFPVLAAHSTVQNKTSSRSHVVVFMTVEQRAIPQSDTVRCRGLCLCWS